MCVCLRHPWPPKTHRKLLINNAFVIQNGAWCFCTGPQLKYHKKSPLNVRFRLVLFLFFYTWAAETFRLQKYIYMFVVIFGFDCRFFNWCLFYKRNPELLQGRVLKQEMSRHFLHFRFHAASQFRKKEKESVVFNTSWREFGVQFSDYKNGSVNAPLNVKGRKGDDQAAFSWVVETWSHVTEAELPLNFTHRRIPLVLWGKGTGVAIFPVPVPVLLQRLYCPEKKLFDIPTLKEVQVVPGKLLHVFNPLNCPPRSTHPGPCIPGDDNRFNESTLISSNNEVFSTQRHWELLRLRLRRCRETDACVWVFYFLFPPLSVVVFVVVVCLRFVQACFFLGILLNILFLFSRAKRECLMRGHAGWRQRGDVTTPSLSAC